MSEPLHPGALWIAAGALLVVGGLLLARGLIGRREAASVWPGAGCLVAASWMASTGIGWTQAIAAPTWLPWTIAGLLLVFGLRRLAQLLWALGDAEAERARLEARLHDVTAETERNFAQLSELRVEQVTELERKRIAADLHDDLGAKLLTIVHTCDNERIATLGREALDEMRLSVRGLSGRPMPLGDAMADWRAETVQRLAQTNIQVEWQALDDEVSHLLAARTYVQTTRILREAVSNIIKHSGASHCEVRCFADAHEYGLVVRDNGRGMVSASPSALDRGHGLASMKHRARQLQGKCEVDSGIGTGTVIRLSLPF